MPHCLRGAWYDANNKNRRLQMVRRLLSALGIVEIVVIVVVLVCVAVAIRQILQ